ncbi:DUF1761 domain-containing protein [Candidatus Gottesmanbacteria bacterium]|nr:DUF1761 domain-containing protein [Candidatus Gottesmanbacteria bacterium]
MPQIDVNWLAIFVSAVVSMVIGFLWYGPLFGKQWMKLMDMTEKNMQGAKKGMQAMYAKSFVTMLVLGYVLAVFVGISGDGNVTEGALTGFWLWLGFMATTGFTETLFSGKSMNLFFINTGYQLAYMLVMGGMLAAWK